MSKLNINDLRKLIMQGKEFDDDEINNEEFDDHDDDIDDNSAMANMMMSMFPSIMEATLNLTKLIIDNKVRNNEKISDDDIYQLYCDSFKHINNTFRKD